MFVWCKKIMLLFNNNHQWKIFKVNKIVKFWLHWLSAFHDILYSFPNKWNNLCHTIFPVINAWNNASWYTRDKWNCIWSSRSSLEACMSCFLPCFLGRRWILLLAAAFRDYLGKDSKTLDFMVNAVCPCWLIKKISE